MRTGSSFIGKTIGWRDDVFYWFEPLRKNRPWTYIRDHNLLCHNLNLDCKVLQKDDPLSSEQTLALMNDIFHCNLSSHGNKVTDINFSNILAPPSWKKYQSCVLKTKRNRLLAQETCINHLQDACKSSTHRVLKVLRIDLNSAAALLESNPRLKIMYIVRDPRGIINSHFTTMWYRKNLQTKQAIDQDITVLCSRMRSDIITGKRLETMYPTRVKIIQYEGMEDITTTVNNLYSFFNMKQSSKYVDFIHSVAGRPAEQKRNGGFHPFSFRRSLSWDIIQIANRHCGDIYNELGIKMFTKESDFRNTNISTIKNELPFAVK